METIIKNKLNTKAMIEEKVNLDISKWMSYKRENIQPHIQEIVSNILAKQGVKPEDAIYRGGFGMKEDYERLLATGSDYEDCHCVLQIDGKEQKVAATYASPFGRLGYKPWVRGFDPLYWALRGHGCKEQEGFNPVNVIVMFRKENTIPLGCESFEFSDLFAFKSITPSVDNIAAIAVLEFDKALYKKLRDEADAKYFAKPAPTKEECEKLFRELRAGLEELSRKAKI